MECPGLPEKEALRLDGAFVSERGAPCASPQKERPVIYSAKAFLQMLSSKHRMAIRI